MKIKIAIASISLIASTVYSSPLMVEDKLEGKVEIIEAIKNNKNLAEHGNFKIIDDNFKKWELRSFFIENDSSNKKTKKITEIKKLKDTNAIKVIPYPNGNILNFKITPHDNFIKLRGTFFVPSSNKFGLYYEIKINDTQSYPIIKKDNTSRIKDGSFKMDITIFNDKNRKIHNKSIKTYKHNKKNIWTPKFFRINSEDEIRSFVLELSSIMADTELRNIKLVDLTNIEE